MSLRPIVRLGMLAVVVWLIGSVALSPSMSAASTGVHFERVSATGSELPSIDLCTVQAVCDLAAETTVDIITSPPGQVATDVVGGARDVARFVGGGWMEDLANGLADATESVIETTFSWWLTADSIDLSNAGTQRILALTTAIAWIVLVLIVIWQGLRTVVTRSGKPLGELFQGLVVGTLVLGAATTVLPLALVLSDELTNWILSAGMATGSGALDGQTDPGTGEERASLLADALSSMIIPGTSGVAIVLVIIICFIAVIFGLFMALMLFLKQTALPIFQVMLPIAAVGQAGGDSTRRWLPTVIASIMAITLYKPIVALILVLGLAMFGESETLIDSVRGLVILGLSVLALPTLVRMFAPFSARLAGGGASFGGLMAAGAGVAAAGAMYGARDSAPGTQTAASEDSRTTADLADQVAGAGGPGDGAGLGSGDSSSEGDGTGGGEGTGPGVAGAIEAPEPAGGEPEGSGAGAGDGTPGTAMAPTGAGTAGTGSESPSDGAGSIGDSSSGPGGLTGGGAASTGTGAGTGTSAGASAAGAGGGAASAGTAGTAGAAAASGGASLAAQAAIQAASSTADAADAAVQSAAADVAAEETQTPTGNDSGNGSGTNSGNGDER